MPIRCHLARKTVCAIDTIHQNMTNAISPSSGISSFFCPTQIHMGKGSIELLPGLLAQQRSSAILLVIDKAVLESPFGQSVLRMLDSSNVTYSIFSDIEPDPSDTVVAKGFSQLPGTSGCGVVAIGGGSSMDVAKAIGILATNGGRIHDYEGIDKYSTPPLPLIAVPTTAGTGSEVSGSCVITDAATGRKMSIRHARLNPARHAILDPDAVRTLPAHVAAHAGVDAFVHALESLTSRQANLVTDAINLQAISLLSSSLPAFVADRQNSDAALNCLVGSALTGMVFGQTGLGNVHCMARFVGAKYHVSHGLSNALCLPVVARFNATAVPGKYAQVARAMAVSSHDTPEAQAVHAALDAIARLCVSVGIPAGLRDVGASQDDLAPMAADCAKAGYNRWNPRETSEADFLELFKAAY